MKHINEFQVWKKGEPKPKGWDDDVNLDAKNIIKLPFFKNLNKIQKEMTIDIINTIYKYKGKIEREDVHKIISTLEKFINIQLAET